MAKPTGLILRGGVWIVRVDVPKDLRSIIGSTTLKRSLKTGDYEEACVLVHGVKAEFARKIADARKQARGEPVTRQELIEEIKAFRLNVDLGPFGFLPDQAPAKPFTMRRAFDEGWMPSKNRSANTVTEVSRYVDEFEALNEVRDIGQYDRTHWAAWRKDCLDRHGPGATAFKRFSMMKTVVEQAISAGLFERKNFHGVDVTMAKIKGKKLRNEGWLPAELKTWFGQPLFKGDRSGPHPDADYWASVIIAYTGAAIIEVSNMNSADVAERHGYWTMRLWRDKSANSDRIIPIPKQVLDLGFLDYVQSRPKASPLFVTGKGERVSNKNLSQQFSRLRQKAGIRRAGADAHGYRHHLKTLLPDVGCPERVSDYITGHAPPNVGRTYGKVEFATARKYLDQIDLGVTIPKWKGGR